MISHIHIGIHDFPRAQIFYAALMQELGLVLKFSDPEQCWAGWHAPEAPRPLFLIGKPYNGQEMNPGNGAMIALLANTRKIVDLTYAKAMSLGATSEGVPGFRPDYHPNYYGAYFRDLDGNKLCICCHEDEDRDVA